MASRFVMFCVSLILFAFLTPSLAFDIPPGPPPPPTKNVTKQDIASICSKTHDPKFCLATLWKIPKSNRTTLKDLANSVINAANSFSTEGYNAIQPLIASTKEPGLKDAYTLCLQHYYNAREEFNSCKFSLNSPVFYMTDLHILVVQPNNAIVETKTCEIDLQLALNNKPVTPLTDRNNKMAIYSNLVSVVGSYLYDSLKSAGFS